MVADSMECSCYLRNIQDPLTDGKTPYARWLGKPFGAMVEYHPISVSDDPEIPEWLQEFRENLVDDEIPLQGGSHARSSHEASLEPTAKRREDLGKHNVYTHFPKDRNCEICKRTKITRPHAEDAMAKPYLVQKILVN